MLIIYVVFPNWYEHLQNSSSHEKNLENLNSRLCLFDYYSYKQIAAQPNNFLEYLTSEELL